MSTPPLLMENEYLHKEVDRLQSLLSSKSIPSMPSTIKQHLSLEEKVDVFRNLFKGREDVFARRWYSRTSGKSGYQPVCRNEWDRQLCDKKRYKCWFFSYCKLDILFMPDKNGRL